MKFFLTLLPLVAGALAAPDTTTAQTTTATAPLTAVQTCLAACSPADVNCQAICVGVPHPGDSQVNAVNDCVSKCPQGDGTQAQTDKYAACRNGCISSYIITSGTAAPGGAYTTAIAPGVSNTAATTASGSASGSASHNSSATAKSSSSSGMAAPTSLSLGATGSTLGLIFAAFAML